MKWYNLILTLTIALCISCGDKNDNSGGNNGGNTDEPPVIIQPTFDNKYIGADLSQWLAYKNDGAEWKENNIAIDNLPSYFSNNGYSIARLRLFVNPDLNSTACQNLEYVIESAHALQSAGMTICLDFHYSDTWADPAKQYKPSEWSALDATALKNKIYEYTKETLNVLKGENISVSHIQIGNEITAGMLWNTGRIGVWSDTYDTPTQWASFLSLLSNASKACREVYPQAKIIVHTDRGGDVETAKRYYERIANIDYDIIGLSYYPYWHGSLSHLSATLGALSTKFPNKELMIMETGFGYNEWSDDSATAQYGNYASTPEGQEEFMQDLISTLKQYEHVTGVFYWFPEETKIDWRSKYRIDLNRGLFDKETGNVLPAFYVMPQFAQ